MKTNTWQEWEKMIATWRNVCIVEIANSFLIKCKNTNTTPNDGLRQLSQNLQDKIRAEIDFSYSYFNGMDTVPK